MSTLEVCSICLVNLPMIYPEEGVALTTCNHKFHNECLVKWLAEKDTCPNCRKQIVDDSTDIIYTSVHQYSNSVINMTGDVMVVDEDYLYSTLIGNTATSNSDRATAFQNAAMEIADLAEMERVTPSSVQIFDGIPFRVFRPTNGPSYRRQIVDDSTDITSSFPSFLADLTEDSPPPPTHRINPHT